VGGEQLELNADQELSFPRGVAHRWWNAGDEMLTFEGLARPEHRALNQVQVEVAVVVVIQQRASLSGHLHEIEFAGHAVEVHEVEARLPGGVLERPPVRPDGGRRQH